MSPKLNTLIDRENILSNPYAIKKIQEEIGVQGFEFEGQIRFLKSQIAQFYKVDERTIDNIIEQNREEIIKNGYEIITGKRLKEAKIASNNEIDFVIRTPNKVGLFTFRSFLNVAMLLQTSEVAKKVRSRMLDIVIEVLNERGSDTKTINQKDELFLTSYMNNAEYRKNFVDALNQCVENFGQFKYPYFTNMIYRDLFGEDAAEYRKLLKLSQKDKTRHTFYREVLDVVSSYENGVASAIKQEFQKKGSLLSQKEATMIFQDSFKSPFLPSVRETARKLMASRDNALRDIVHDPLKQYIDSLTPEEFERFLQNDTEKHKDTRKLILQIIDGNRDIIERLKDK